MGILIRCPTCGREYNARDELAGKLVKCSHCGGVMQVGDAGASVAPKEPPPSPAGPAGGPPVPPTGYMPPPLYQAPVPVGSGAVSDVKLSGVFMIIAGVLNGLWGLLMLIEVFAVQGGMIKMDPGDPPKEVMVGIFVVLFLLSVAACAIQLIGGIHLVGQKRVARKTGLAAAIVSVVSAFGCCVWPLCLAAGIYTLVILFRESTRQALSGQA